MIAYIIRRLLLMIPTLLGIMVINFIVIQAAPGGPVEQMLAQIQGTQCPVRRVSLGGAEGEPDAAVLERAESGGYGVVFPDFPGCVSAGETVQTALTNAGEALFGFIPVRPTVGMFGFGLALALPFALFAMFPGWLNLTM